MKTNSIKVLQEALNLASKEAYQHEIIDTEMEEIEIGERCDYSNKEDWLEDKINSWIEEADVILRLRKIKH